MSVVVLGAPLGPDPVPMQCPSCRAQVISRVDHRPGGFAWVMALLLCGVLCCCLPFCIDDCQDSHHNCPNCGAYLGKHRACCD